MFLTLYLLVVFCGLAMTVREGLWSNTITLFNTIISGLIAYGFYSPITAWVDEKLSGEYTYVLDFVIVWGLFVIAMVLCRALTQSLSKTRVRFKHPIDAVGGPLIGLIAAWVLAAFTMSTLFMAPMPPSSLGDRFNALVELAKSAKDKSTLETLTVPFVVPDYHWLVFTQFSCRSASYGPGGFGHLIDNPFASNYLAEYHKHRQALEKSNPPWLRVSR